MQVNRPSPLGRSACVHVPPPLRLAYAPVPLEICQVPAKSLPPSPWIWKSIWKDPWVLVSVVLTVPAKTGDGPPPKATKSVVHDPASVNTPDAPHPISTRFAARLSRIVSLAPAVAPTGVANSKDATNDAAAIAATNTTSLFISLLPSELSSSTLEAVSATRDRDSTSFARGASTPVSSTFKIAWAGLPLTRPRTPALVTDLIQSVSLLQPVATGLGESRPPATAKPRLALDARSSGASASLSPPSRSPRFRVGDNRTLHILSGTA